MIESSHFSDDEQLAHLVRSTLHKATQPDNGRLKKLMPPPPTRKRKLFLNPVWQKQFAAVCTLFILGLGFFGLYRGSQSSAWHSDTTPTSIAVTATFTSEPTATNAEQEADMTSTAVAFDTLTADITATPSPDPSPIAALPALIITNP